MRLKQFVNKCFAKLVYQLKVALLLWIWLFLDGPSYVTFTGVFFMDQLSGVPPMWPPEKILSRDEMPCSVLLAKAADKTERWQSYSFFSYESAPPFLLAHIARQWPVLLYHRLGHLAGLTS